MKEFKGELEGIPPGKIIDKDKSADFDNFFLVLGLIYNDLKDLVFFLDLFNKTYRKPILDGTELPSIHLGEWAGIQIHMNRLMISFISEFLIFLRTNKSVISTIQFKLIEKAMPQNVRNEWYKILRAVNDDGGDDFLEKIARIRSNVSFHYDHSLGELRTGYINKFFISKPNIYNEKAFYSLGGSMETTRFYYCDGAAEEYLNKHMKVSSKENYYGNIRDLVEKTNIAIMFIMTQYLSDKSR